MKTITIYVLCFIVYSFIGWVYEVGLYIVRDKKLVNRGFLNGPYLPIYGFGAVFVILLFGNMKNIPALFLASAVISCILEYVTSYVMEKLFNARWWDYSDYPFNLNGRICLYGALVFGALSVLLVKFIHPAMTGFFDRFSAALLEWSAVGVTVVFTADLCITVLSISGFRKKLEEASEHFREKLEEKQETAKERRKAAREFLLNRLNVQEKRILNAFPRMKMHNNNELLAEIRKAFKEHSLNKKK